MDKPTCDPGEYGDNVYTLITRVNRALSSAGLKDKADEFNEKYEKAESYDAVWDLAEEYVTFI